MGNANKSPEKETFLSTQLYVLQLTDGKYYVGVTNNLELRLE